MGKVKQDTVIETRTWAYYNHHNNAKTVHLSKIIYTQLQILRRVERLRHMRLILQCFRYVVKHFPSAVHDICLIRNVTSNTF